MHRKLTERQVIAVLGVKEMSRARKRALGWNKHTLAAHLSVSHCVIENIWAGNCYKEIYHLYAGEKK